jgi:hypothetical protein
MQIVSKYFKSTQDYFNLTKVNKKYLEITGLFRINPIPIHKRIDSKMFPMIQTIEFDPYTDYPGYEYVDNITLRHIDPTNQLTKEFPFEHLQVDKIHCLINYPKLMVVIFGEHELSNQMQDRLLSEIRTFLLNRYMIMYSDNMKIVVNSCFKFDRRIYHKYFSKINYIKH